MSEVSKSLEEYRVNLAVEKKNSEDLRGQLGLCQKECLEKGKREVEAKSKVSLLLAFVSNE